MRYKRCIWKTGTLFPFHVAYAYLCDFFSIQCYQCSLSEFNENAIFYLFIYWDNMTTCVLCTKNDIAFTALLLQKIYLNLLLTVITNLRSKNSRIVLHAHKFWQATSCFIFHHITSSWHYSHIQIRKTKKVNEAEKNTYKIQIRQNIREKISTRMQMRFTFTVPYNGNTAFT